jgi:hypothetical protein
VSSRSGSFPPGWSRSLLLNDSVCQGFGPGNPSEMVRPDQGTHRDHYAIDTSYVTMVDLRKASTCMLFKRGWKALSQRITNPLRIRRVPIGPRLAPRLGNVELYGSQRSYHSGVTPPGVTPPGVTPPGVTPPGVTLPGVTPSLTARGCPEPCLYNAGLRF